MATPTAAGQIPAKYNPASNINNSILQQCRDYYKISNEQYEECIAEGQETIALYHNRQYTQAQLNQLKLNGQPAETFNVINMMTNVIIGYMETVITEITAEPKYPSNAIPSLLVNDVVQHVLEDNDWETIQKFAKIDGLLTGLMCVYEDVKDTGIKDQFGRPIFEVKLEHVPSWQVRIDPHSKREDYSDARFIHHPKWMSEEEIKTAWPKKKDQLTEYYNYLEDGQADWGRVYNGNDVGRYREHNNYLVCKTVLIHNKKVYSVIWHDEIILEKKEITFKEARFPYRITKLSNSDKAEYYGPFRHITETQKAINQALLQVQLLVNTSKAFVEEGSVDDIEEFRELFQRVNAVIPVVSLQGVKIEDMSRDIMQQYTIIDQALNRIKMVLGINDSFLGQAYASDSGRKVQIQKLSSSAQLTMVVDRVSSMFKFVGQDIVSLVQQFYRGTQMLKIADPLNSYHYIEVNKPLLMPTGQIDPATGQPQMQPVIVADEDPNTGEPVTDKEGNIVMVPLNDPTSDIEFTDLDVVVRASRADNSEERNQLLFETYTNGPMGQMLMQMNPSGALRAQAMQISEFGTKHSIEIATILLQTAQMIDKGQIDPRAIASGTDVQSILGASLGGSTGNSQNMPQPNSGQQPGNAGGIPQVGKEGGRPNV